MNTDRLRIAFFLGTLVVFSTSPILGCSCDGAPNPPCRAFGNAPVIFEGVVESFEDLGPNSRRATFSVNEFFKGGNASRTVVYTGDGGSDCGYPFQVGQRYLVYAYGSGGDLLTSYCGRTRPYSSASEDLDYFRSRSGPSKETGVIFGSVKKFALGYAENEDFGLTSPLAGIQVMLRGPRSANLRTNSTGEFKVSGFPAGEYFIETRLPRSLTVSANSPTSNMDLLKLERDGCVGAKIYVDFEGQISGKVLYSDGKGAAGFDVTLVPAEYRFEGPNDTGPLLEWSVSRSDGSFLLEGIPPGRYRLGIGIGGAFSSFGKKGQVFYPNTKDPLKSSVIVITERKKLKNINLTAPTGP